VTSRDGCTKSIEALLKNNLKPKVDYVYGDYGYADDEVGCMPLQLACMHLKPECLKSYCTLVDQASEQGQTRLHSIPEKTPVFVVGYSVEGKAPLDAQDHEGYMPLAIVISKGNQSAAKYLIK
jgi:hypothetical protein